MHEKYPGDSNMKGVLSDFSLLRQLLSWLKKLSWYCSVSDEFIMKLKTRTCKMHQLVLLTIKMTQAAVHSTLTHSNPLHTRTYIHTQFKIICLAMCQMQYYTYYLINANGSNNRMIGMMLIICDVISFVILLYGIQRCFIIRMLFQNHSWFSAAKLYENSHISAWHVLYLL